MPFNPENHRRRSIRLPGYDYSQPGAYFITICTLKRACLFGDIVNGVVQLNPMGRLVQECWMAIPQHFPHVVLDAFVVMPNHVHGILVIVEKPSVGVIHFVGATHASPLRARPRGPQRQSLASIVGSFKSAVTKCINEYRGTPGAPVWQRNYYEHIIRNEESLNRMREYILQNPLRWHLDRENPERTGVDDLWNTIFSVGDQ